MNKRMEELWQKACDIRASNEDNRPTYEIYGEMIFRQCMFQLVRATIQENENNFKPNQQLQDFVVSVADNLKQHFGMVG